MAAEYDDVTLSVEQMKALVGLLSRVEATGVPGNYQLQATTFSEPTYNALIGAKNCLEACIEETEVIVAKRQRRATSLVRAGLVDG